MQIDYIKWGTWVFTPDDPPDTACLVWDSNL